MCVVIWQRETQQERIRAQKPLELVDDWNGAALAHEHRLAAEGGFERGQGGLRLQAGGRDQVRLGAVSGLDLDTDGLWADFLQMPGYQWDDPRRMLVGDEAGCDLGARPRGNDRLAAFTLVTAGQAIDLEGG